MEPESTKLLVYLVNWDRASTEFNFSRNSLVKYISTTKRQNFVRVTTFAKFPFILFRKRFYLLRNKSWSTGVILSSNLSEYIRDERAYFNGVLLVFLLWYNASWTFKHNLWTHWGFTTGESRTHDKAVRFVSTRKFLSPRKKRWLSVTQFSIYFIICENSKLSRGECAWCSIAIWSLLVSIIWLKNYNTYPQIIQLNE